MLVVFFYIYFQVFQNASHPLAMLIRFFHMKMCNFYLAQICLPCSSVKNQRTSVGVCCGLTPVSSSATHSLLFAPLQWNTEKNHKSKTEETNGKAKAKQNKEFIHYFSLAHRCSAIFRTAGLQHLQLLLGKTDIITPNVTAYSSFPPPFIAKDIIWHGICLGQSGSAVPAVSQPVCWYSSLRSRKGKYQSATAKTWMCYQHCFVLKSKKYPIQAAMRKINFVPAKTSAM